MSLSSVSLRLRFAAFLGGIAAVVLLTFFFFGRYATGVTEQAFEKRGELLVETMGQESVYNLLMQDTEGLEERLSKVVDRGTVVAGGFYDAEGTLLAANALTEQLPDLAPVLGEVPAVSQAETEAGLPVLVASAPVVNEDELLGHVVVALPAAAIEAQKQTSALIALGIPFLIALLAGVILLLVRRTVINPVDALRQAAVAVEQGDLSVRVDVKQRDEIGQLAASFNAMVAASERNMQALDEQRSQAEAAQAQAEALQHEANAEREYLQQRFEQISIVIEAVTAGDLTQRLSIERNDAVGALMDQINHMIEDLEGLIREVHAAGNQLSRAATDVAAAADEMSSSAASQAGQTLEVASAIEEMSSTIADSSRNAYEANETAQHASSLATNGEQVFYRTREGMSRIADIVQGSADKVTALGESSAQIGEIIQVISEIADQTNLLALNAAIEAARAGEQGRGFAVVADEVRKLAERTTSATKEIGEMIRRIQQNTDDVVASMTKGNEEVTEGVHQSEEAAQSLSDILTSITKMVSMIDYIAAASQQQSATSGEIARNVEGISGAAREVSNATHALSSTAEDMNQQATVLRQLIARFQIRQHAASLPA